MFATCLKEPELDRNYNPDDIEVSSVDYTLSIPLSRYSADICHYIPPQFPVPACLDRRTVDSCKRSWMMIVQGKDINGVASTTNFYNKFYDRLSLKAGAFKSVFPGGVSGIVFRGQLLIKAVGRMVGIQIDTCVEDFEALGKFHNKLDIRLWMFSDYFITLIETLNEVLGPLATYAQMEEWYRLCGFCCFFLLEGAMKDKVTTGEVGVANYAGVYTGSTRSKVNLVQGRKKSKKTGVAVQSK